MSHGGPGTIMFVRGEEGYALAFRGEFDISCYATLGSARLPNASDEEAHEEITVFFAHREPAVPCRITVAPRSTKYVRFNQLADPEPIPKDTDYASVLELDVPIAAQHSRFDFRQKLTTARAMY